MDLFQKFAESEFDIMRELAHADACPYFLPFEDSEGTEVVYRGRRLVMAGSNNYLGLSTNPRVREAAVRAVQTFGTSCTGSRLLNGTLALHLELEQELAAYVGKPAALVFSTGFQVNLGVISALVGENDIVVIDREDHASVYDGCRLARGSVRRFRHNDVEQLAHILRSRHAAAGALVVVEGVYSMTGEIAPLPDIVTVCTEYGARLMVDDAHGIGVLGGGRGTVAHFGVTDSVDLVMGTFSKSLASVGGFVAGPEDVIHFLKYAARSLIFSASISPANAAAALAALRVLRAEPARVTRLTEIAARIRCSLREIGLDIGRTETPIVPIKLGDDAEVLAAWRTVMDAGVYVNCIVPPAVAADACCLRSSYMATHTDEHLERIMAAFRVLSERTREGEEPSVMVGVVDGFDPAAPTARVQDEVLDPGTSGEAVGRLIDDMVAAVGAVDDYTCIFTKQECLDGTLQPTETIWMKHSRRLGSVYLRWIAGPFKDREIIYAPGRYGPKMKVREGGGIRRQLGTVSVAPDDRFARKGNRHSIKEMGLFPTVEQIRSAFEAAKRDPRRYVSEGMREEVFLGQRSTVITQRDRVDRVRARVDVAIHNELRLPTMVRVQDAHGGLVECHTFSRYTLNPGLTSLDFDLENPEYRFRDGKGARPTEPFAGANAP